MELVDHELVERLHALELAARIAAEGALAGLHRSPRRGSSVEFAEHKEYAPGDELRHVDWKTYGRSDRLYVKRFEEETELHVLLVVDSSESMRYGAGDADKLRHASVLAAGLAYLLLTRRDRAGLLCSTGEALPIGARPSHLRRILSSLSALEARGRASLPALLQRADALTPKRTEIVVFSDFLDDDRDEVLAAARSLKSRGHDPIFVQLLTPDERSLPDGETAWFESADDGARVLVDPVTVREAYQAELGALVAGYEQSLARARIPFAQLDTTQPIADNLALLASGALAPGRR
jgi:uncharacterized protein (DUF58 family)